VKEKEIRERIERFLRKTARNVVLPASYCLYYQAVKHHRYDLLDDEPTQAEQAFFA